MWTVSLKLQNIADQKSTTNIPDRNLNHKQKLKQTVCKPRHSLFPHYFNVWNYLNAEDASYPDSTADSLQTQRSHFSIITVLKAHTKRSQEWRPSQLYEDQEIRNLLMISGVHLHANRINTLNMGLTCSRWVALVKGAWTWLTASIRALAVFAICSISTLYRSFLCFSLATSDSESLSYNNPILKTSHSWHNTIKLNLVFKQKNVGSWMEWQDIGF